MLNTINKYNSTQHQNGMSGPAVASLFCLLFFPDSEC